MYGKVEFTFAGSSVLLEADANQLDDAECNRSLRGLKSVAEVDCVRQSLNPTTGTHLPIRAHHMHVT